MATVIKTWVATKYAGGFLSQGQSVTLTYHFTQEFEAQVPCGSAYGSNYSLDTGVFVYPSSDGGANFATAPLLSFVVPGAASGNRQAAVRVTTGQYAVELRSSSPSTTVYALTQEVITAIS